MTRFRFGVTAAATGDLAAWMATARRVESAGFATLLLPETTRGPAPLPALAAAAAATTTLHVGSWVLCEPLHDPARLTWEARTLHDLAGDRVELGLGAGRPGAEHDAAALGLPYPGPAARVSRLAGTLRRLRAEVPGLRLLVAASGPRMLRLAGREADTVAAGWAPDTGLAAARAVLTHVAGDAERAAGLVAVNDSPAPWLARARTTTAALAAAGAVTVLTGTPRAMADELLRRRDALGVGYWTVPEPALAAFAPVVELLAGH